MGYRNLSSFYTTSRELAAKLCVNQSMFNKRFESILDNMGFDGNKTWYQSYGNTKSTMYIFSGEDVFSKICNLFSLYEKADKTLDDEKDIADILVAILPDEKYRTVESRYTNSVDLSFNPELDPRAEGVRWIINNHFRNLI